MLVLSRKRLERVLIGADIRITVVKLEGNQVRIGIEAPDDLTILRAELLPDEEVPTIDRIRSTSPKA